VFDHRRTTMTGFSFYADGSDTAWYVNLAHADIENRMPRRKADVLLAAIPENCLILAHNAPFELVMFEQCLGVILKNILCTLQLAVSHHGPDEYDRRLFFDRSRSPHRQAPRRDRARVRQLRSRDPRPEPEWRAAGAAVAVHRQDSRRRRTATTASSPRSPTATI
jgi:hypothetical protein